MIISTAKSSGAWDSSTRKRKGVPLGDWRRKCLNRILCNKCLEQGKRIHLELCPCKKKKSYNDDDSEEEDDEDD